MTRDEAATVHAYRLHRAGWTRVGPHGWKNPAGTRATRTEILQFLSVQEPMLPGHYGHIADEDRFLRLMAKAAALHPSTPLSPA
jgi:hypothetical protein